MQASDLYSQTQEEYKIFEKDINYNKWAWYRGSKILVWTSI